MKFETEIVGDGTMIIVREPERGFWAVYEREANSPQLHLRQRAETEDHDVLAFAFQAAINKARELGWIV